MNRMCAFPLLVVVASLPCLLAPGSAHAQGVDGLQLPILFSTLPQVQSYVLDGNGHLTLLAGTLTGPSEDPPHSTALRFVQDRSDLYPIADDTVLAVGWWSRAGSGSTTVGIYQLVDEFEAVDDGIVCTVDREGAVTRIEGIVVHNGDLPSQPGNLISDDAAFSVALGQVPEAGPEPPNPATIKVLYGAQRRRAWQVDIAWVEESGESSATHRTSVFVDAYSSAVLGEIDENIDDLAAAFGTLAAPEPPSSPSTPSPASCVPHSTPPGDFTTLAGTNQWDSNPWTGWTFQPGVPAAEYWAGTIAKCGSWCYGFISRTQDYLTPVGHSLLKLTFPSVAVAMGATLRYSATGHGARFVVNANTTDATVVWLDLGRKAAWWYGTPVGGFYTRRFALEIHTPGAHGQLSRIDLYPGGNLEFSGNPYFLIDDEQAHSFGSNVSRLRLNHQIRNVGCDLTSPWDPARLMHFSMCKTADPSTCRTDLLTCRLNRDPGVALVNDGDLSSGESRWYQLCADFQLPPATPSSNLTNWTIAGTFDDMPAGGDPDKQTQASFDLLAQGIPNLKVSTAETVEAWEPIPGDWKRLETLERGQTFSLLFGVQSLQYPATNVPVEVKLCARPPAPMATRPCVTVADTVLPSVGSIDGPYEPVQLDGLSLGADLLPDPEQWTTLDVEISIDPDDAVGEYKENDNGFTVASWITLSVGDLDAAIGDVIASDGFAEPIPAPLPNLRSPTESSMWTNHYYDFFQVGVLGPASDNPWPHLSWPISGLPADSRITGALVRYRRVASGSTSPALMAGQLQGPEMSCTAGGVCPNLGSSSVDLTHDGQWHLALWRDVNHLEPLGGLDIDSLVDLGSTASNTTATFYLESDKACIPRGWGNCDWPTFVLDFVRLYGSENPQSAWDAAPYRLMYFDSGEGIWYEMPSTVSASSTWTLGVLVTGVSASHPVSESKVSVDRESPIGTSTALTVTGQVPHGPSSAIFAFEDPGGPSTWSPSEPGEWTFSVSLINIADTVPSNDQKDFTVQVGCATSLTLPTAVTQ